MLKRLIIVVLAICACTESLRNSTEQILLKKSKLSQPGFNLSMEVHKKIYSYTRKAKAFRGLTFEETVAFMNELYDWEAPQEIQDHFGYSIWGYDYERRPVWYDGIGKQDIRWVVENGTFPTLEKHYLKSMIHIMQSIQAADTPDDEVREAVIIWDMNGFSMRQIGHLPTNYVTKQAVDIARPFMGNVLEKVEVFASNKNVWLPRLLKTIPLDIVPEWIGGKKNTKPLWVYG